MSESPSSSPSPTIPSDYEINISPTTWDIGNENSTDAVIDITGPGYFSNSSTVKFNRPGGGLDTYGVTYYNPYAIRVTLDVNGLSGDGYIRVTTDGIDSNYKTLTIVASEESSSESPSSSPSATAPPCVDGYYSESGDGCDCAYSSCVPEGYDRFNTEFLCRNYYGC